MIKLDEVFVPFAREVNNVYEALFPNFPMYPKFSVLRLMVVCWRRDVYDPLKAKLRTHMTSFVREFQNELFTFGLEQKNQQKSKNKHITMVGQLSAGFNNLNPGKSLNLTSGMPPL